MPAVKTGESQEDHPHEPFGGWWWRASGYEYRDGYIRPVEGASFTPIYPWASYREAAREATRVKELKPPRATPHGDLMKIAIDWARQPMIVYDDSMVPVILDYCSRWGLLGIALHAAVEVSLPPLPPAPEDTPGTTYRQTRHVVVAGEWQTIQTSTNVDHPPQSGVTWRAPPDGFTRTYTPTRLDGRPHVPELAGAFRFERPGWADYFPLVPAERRELFQYPAPHEEAFWHLYAEPLAEWREWLQLIELWSQFLPVQGNQWFDGEADLDEYQRTYFKRGHANVIAQLLHLTSAAAPSLEIIRPGIYEPRWSCPSLLSAIGLMIREDLLGDSAAFCANPSCGRYYIKGRKNQRFCSGKCKNATGVRELRRRRREGKTMSASARRNPE